MITNIILNMYKEFKKSGIIHKLIQQKIISKLNEFKYALDIVEFIENEILTLTQFDKNNPLNSGIAFPVGVNINEIAAHFTPDKSNNPLLKYNDIIKIDYGVHINGYITDGAFSYCKSNKYNDLIEISKNATNIGIKHSGPDAVLGDIGYYIQEYIESKEIEIDKKIHQIKSIYDLSGHNIDRYIIHKNKAVPNIKIPYYERMLENEVYAIETFPTTGDGHIRCSLDECNHFMIEPNNVVLNFNNDKIKQIYDVRKTLAFCPRWFNFKIPDSKFITKYPTLKTTDNGMVAQWEKTIFIKNNGIEILN